MKFEINYQKHSEYYEHKNIFLSMGISNLVQFHILIKSRHISVAGTVLKEKYQRPEVVHLLLVNTVTGVKKVESSHQGLH